MPSILSDADKATVKRFFPKSTSKIFAVAVAKLYISRPNSNRWSYTGLSGAAVLSEDRVGNTIWLKMVDISPANRGIIWDQEIYEGFEYYTDRTFFTSFEIPDAVAGLSFADLKECKKFTQKVLDREKNCSSSTKKTAFRSYAGGEQTAAIVGEHKSHSRLGGLFGKRNISSSSGPPSREPVYSSVPTGLAPSSRPQSAAGIDLSDPKYAPILDELVSLGISRDAIEENRDFIISYIKQKEAEDIANGIAGALDNHSRAPPPPPPPAANAGNRRGAPPAPPPSRRPVPGRAPSPPRNPSPPRTPSPPPAAEPRSRFRVPALPDAGKFAQKEGPLTGNRSRSSSEVGAGPKPPPPPRRQPEPEEDHTPTFRVPASIPPPPPPSRNQRDVPIATSNPPPLPPKVPTAPGPALPARNSTDSRPVPPPPAPPPPSSSLPPPPPPLPSSSNSAGPPPPPLPPPGTGTKAPALPQAPAPGRDDLMASIRGGGAGGLRKVKDSEKRDRSAAAVPGAETAAPVAAGAGAAAAAGPDGGLAGALASALSARKKKVAGSDDEKSDDDDW